jgi:hypothetical protein
MTWRKPASALGIVAALLAGSTGTGAAAARSIVATAPDGSATPLTASARGRTMIFTLAGVARPLRVPLGRDIAANDSRHSVTLLVSPAPGQVLVIDTYASAPQSLARCQAGEELFMRLLDFAAARPAQTWQLKIASCIDTLELSDSGGEWSKADQTLTLNWLTGPTGKPETRRYKVTNGKVTAAD